MKKMSFMSKFLASALILVANHAEAKEMSIPSTNVAIQKMMGKITLSGPVVRSATSGRSTSDGRLPENPVDSLEVTDANGEIEVQISLLPEIETLNDKDQIDAIKVRFEGKRSSGHALWFNIAIQPLDFAKGVYPNATRYPFNSEVKYETLVDEQGFQRAVSRTSVAKNGFSLGINSLECGKRNTTIKIDEIHFDFTTGKLSSLKFSFDGESYSPDSPFHGTVELK